MNWQKELVELIDLAGTSPWSFPIQNEDAV